MLHISSEKQVHREGFIVRTVTVSSPGLPESFCGYRIVQLTDLHLGPATSVEFIRRALELVKELRPSSLFLTGDYIQNSRLGVQRLFGRTINTSNKPWLMYRREVRDLAKALAKLIRPEDYPDGVYAVFGNHDYLEGFNSLKKALADSVCWLTNRSIVLAKDSGSILIAGVDDIEHGQPNLQAALGDPDWDKHFFRILLSHNPDIVLHKDNKLLNRANLILSGHTHGGQIRLPVFGAPFTRVKVRKHSMGLSEFEDTKIYTSSGVGCGLIGLRVLCPPEITLIEFVKR